MKTPEESAAEIVNRFSWSSNVSRNGRLVGQQYVVAEAIAEEIRNRENAEIQRLRTLLHEIRCEQLDQGTNKKLTALAHRRRAMKTRAKIIAAFERGSCG